MKTTAPLFPLALAAALLLAACNNSKGRYEASGAFEATEVIVSAQASGQIIQLDLAEGQSLQAGQTVGYIDTIQLHLTKKQLLASIQAASSRTNNVSLLVASLKRQLAQQQSEELRFQSLQRAGAATQKQLDDLHSSIDILQKQLAAQTETLQKANSSLNAELLALQIQVEQINDRIAKSLISTPIAGTVLAQYAEQGELAAQGRALFKLADLSRIYLRAYITADQLTQLKLGQEVPVFVDFGKSETSEYKGVISWISDKAEFTPRTILTKNERANLVYAVKIAVQNDGYLKLGMYGEVRL
jgi:HlyD family secretion protein